MTDKKPTIEVFYDPNGAMAGRRGCVRAHLRNNKAMHSAGKDEKSAILDLLRTLKSFGKSDRESDYEAKWSGPLAPPFEKRSKGYSFVFGMG